MGLPEGVGRVAEIWQSGEVDRLGELLTDDYVGHMLGAGERHGVAEYADTIRRVRAAGPPPAFENLDQFADGDKVCTRVKSTRTGADGAVEVAYGVNISRYEGGKLAEEWAIWTPFQPA
jgi:predicted SnoaL-like aldol condensation-catalyzing enzyme